MTICAECGQLFNCSPEEQEDGCDICPECEHALVQEYMPELLGHYDANNGTEGGN